MYSKVTEQISAYREVPTFSSVLNKRLGERNTGVVPTRIAVLVNLGLDSKIVEVLERLVREGEPEIEVVYALLVLMADAGKFNKLCATNLKVVQDLRSKLSADRLRYLQSRLRDVVAQCG